MHLIILSLLFILILPFNAQAQLTITETQSLSFGSFVIRDFSSVARVTVRTNGTMAYNANAIGFSPGQRAEYDLTGGPANTAYTVTIDASVDPTFGGGGGPPNIRLDQFRVRPNTLQTNGSGVDSFRITARLRTLGGGTFYSDGNYSGSYDFTVQF